jgi:hypothetical protein
MFKRASSHADTRAQSSGEGALNVDAMVQEGAFVIDNVSFYPSAAVGTELTAEADWKRRGLYIGPQFDTLDVAVQEEFEKFLAERGIDESLALFIPEFAEFKEHKVRSSIVVVNEMADVYVIGIHALAREHEEVHRPLDRALRLS